MIFAESTLSNAQRLTLWNSQFDQSVSRWLPFALAPGFIGYAVAAFRALRLSRGEAKSTLTGPASGGELKLPGGKVASTAGRAGAYFPTQSGKLLALAAATMFLFPVYTKLFILRSVGDLKALHKDSASASAAGQTERITALINEWEMKHRGRIALAALSFGLGTWDLVSLILNA